MKPYYANPNPGLYYPLPGRRKLEGFADGAEGLRRALRRFYPSLTDGDEVSVIHFDLLSDEARS